MLKLSTEYQTMLSNILEQAHIYFDRRPQIKGVVLGVSGGIDSALTAALIRMVAEDRKDFKVMGRALTIITNTTEEVKRAIKVGRAFCTDFDEVVLDRLFNSTYVGLRGRPPISMAGAITQKEKIERGNIKARLRMIFLYDLAHREDCIVLSTDNFTELLLGFWTLHGDVGDFGMIQNLFKTEVYGLSAYLARKLEDDMEVGAADALRKCAGAVPTDGLGVSNSDLDQLLPRWQERCDSDPVRGYRTVDQILIDYLNLRKGGSSPVAKRHDSTIFKRDNPENIPRNIVLAK